MQMGTFEMTRQTRNRTAVRMLAAALLLALSVPTAAAAEDQNAARWYTLAERDAALQLAVKHKLPVAVLWYGNNQKAGLLDQWLKQWKASDLKTHFVCIDAETAVQNNQITSVDPFVMKLLQNTSVDLKQLMPPYLLLGSAEGKCYSYVYLRTSPPDAVQAVLKALAHHRAAVGGVRIDIEVKPKPPEPAKPGAEPAALKQKSDAARKLWREGKHEEAMARYRELAAARAADPNSAVAAELAKDEPAINARGTAGLKAAVKAANEGNLDKAAADLAKIETTYKGFRPAAEAARLLAQIKAAQARAGAGGVARKPDNGGAKQPAKPAPEPKAPAGPGPDPEAKPRRWSGKVSFTGKEKDEALATAAMLSRPVALIWYIDGQSAGKVGEWRRMPEVSKHFVSIRMKAEMQGRMISMNDPLLNRMFTTSGMPQGQGLMLPYLFLGTSDGQCHAYVEGGSSASAARTAARTAVKKFGRTLSTKNALAAWRRLEDARRLWGQGKHGAALAKYRDVIGLKAVNPKLPIIAELNKDIGWIDRRGTEELAEAERLLEKGELKPALREVRRIHAAYKGFDTTKDAKELHKKVRIAIKEKALAAKGIGEGAEPDDPMAEKPAKPPDKPDDKPDAGGDKGKDEDKPKPDYEDDF